MSETELAAMLSLFVLGALLVPPADVRAQTPDSLVSLLNASEWQVRASAISQLNQLDRSELPASYASTVIALLEEEATDPDPEASGPGEGYGEYLIALVRGVLRLHDPASLRGLAMLGIEISHQAKEFVVQEGDAALSYLDEAWALEMVSRYSVADTWALMLEESPATLSSTGRTVVRNRIFGSLADSISEFIFVNASTDAGLVTSIPVLEDVASKQQGISRDYALAGIQALEPARDAMSANEFAIEFAELLEAVCLEPQGAKADACSTLDGLLADVTGFISSGDEVSAGGSSRQFATAVDQAAGVLSKGETTLLSGNAAYLAGILEPGEGCVGTNES